MAAGMIRLSMDPLHYAHPPAELHAPPEHFPPCSHDPPRLPCEGADADDLSLPRASTVIAEVISSNIIPPLPRHRRGFRIIEAARSAAGKNHQDY